LIGSEIVKAIRGDENSIIGFQAVTGKEEPLATETGYFNEVEVGVGYSYSFDTGKPINFFYSIPENWWELDEYQFGIDVNIDGYGFTLGIGGEQTLGLHLGNTSVDISLDMLGDVSVKIANQTESGLYSYTKVTIEAGKVIAVGVVAYCAIMSGFYGIVGAIGSLAELLRQLGGVLAPI